MDQHDDPEHVDVVVLARHAGEPWRVAEPAPIVRWEEQIVTFDQVLGWLQENLAGEFVLDQQTIAFLEQMHARTPEGQLVTWSTADLTRSRRW